MLEVATDEVSAEQARRLADQHEASQLVAEEQRAEVETWLSLADNGDGTFSGRFTIPELHGQLLRARLEQSPPQRLSRSRTGQPVNDESLLTGPLSWDREARLGFTELIEHLPTEATGGFTRNTLSVLVHLDHQHLLDQLGSARLDTASGSAPDSPPAGLQRRHHPRRARQRSEPLDLGREARCTTPPNAAPWPSSTTPAPPKAANAPSPGATSTTPTPGPTADPPTSTTPSPSAATTTQRAHDPATTHHHLPTGELRFRRRR